MAADSLTPPVRQDPPVRLLQRTARIQTGATNTLRIPGDSFRDRTASWFATGGGRQPLRRGNEVKYLIDGNEAFQEMAAAIRTANRAGHFIYMSNWLVDDGFELLVDEPTMTLRGLLSEASGNGVMVRGMFWDHLPVPTAPNDRAASNINQLSNGAAIVDARGNESILEIPILGIIPMHVGSQHQKILCVLGEEGLIAFCGGVDFNADRTKTKIEIERDARRPPGDSTATKGAPLHDVHCRIRGPAAADLVKVFTQRWNDHDEGQRFNRIKRPLITLREIPQSAGPHVVQIGRTFGDHDYSFAPGGETTVRQLILRAIGNARRFIYTEDQYFVGNPEAQAALIGALRSNGLRHLTILLTHWQLSDLPLVQRHRREFIGALRRAGGERVRVFYLRPASDDDAFEDGKVRHTYVHSKVWIIDDELAVIGSANTNRRGWSHDNEVAAGIYDTSNDRILTCRLAHWLRIELWKEHLNMSSVEGAAELADGVASAAHWLDLPAGARVRPYDEEEEGDYIPGLPVVSLPLLLAFYDSVIDPA